MPWWIHMTQASTILEKKSHFKSRQYSSMCYRTTKRAGHYVNGSSKIEYGDSSPINHFESYDPTSNWPNWIICRKMHEVFKRWRPRREWNGYSIRNAADILTKKRSLKLVVQWLTSWILLETKILVNGL